MKPRLEKLTLEPKYSFILQKDVYSYYPTPWHYHPEYELVLVIKSSGQRTVGDNAERFTDGDLVFLGPNLPHSYQNDPIYYQGNTALRAEAIVIHFREEFLGKDFFNLPEMISVNQLFDRAKFGIKILGNTRQQITDCMQEMLEVSGYRRITHLLHILELLALSEEYQLLVSPGFVEQYIAAGTDPITKVHEYIITNFRKDISLANAAEVANMSVPSFCRSFKACTRKSFSHYLNEVRVGYACKLLLEDKFNISRICYESGFNNMSNFNLQFKKVTGIPPLKYKKLRTESSSYV
ncbi:AraC family transcriptional regulator [Adhaeribacter arboris]|uniref:AraC family transcriptional regulator n=1 Tax=Adhaeribacter arboris TaxID=2072846 RepID=A0A2T2YEW4_9BACT|nr:AraC family transcriptional regulator [Adhaeribacter arboris]PSR54042.1 AraC family transcriptional regulator [Adhaeribacter arboris]